MLIWLISQISLWCAWQLLSFHERQTKPGGKNFPFYFTGYVGDPLGLALMTYGWSLFFIVDENFLTLAGAGACSLLLTFALHITWSRRSVGHDVTLYDRSGKPTPAGRLHLTYVWLVSGVVFSGLVWILSHMHQWQELGPTLFVIGIIFYGVTVVIDIARGVL